MDVPDNEKVRLGCYFADLISVVCQSTAKTVKIRSLENFWLYSSTTVICLIFVPKYIFHVINFGVKNFSSTSTRTKSLYQRIFFANAQAHKRPPAAQNI